MILTLKPFLLQGTYESEKKQVNKGLAKIKGKNSDDYINNYTSNSFFEKEVFAPNDITPFLKSCQGIYVYIENHHFTENAINFLSNVLISLEKTKVKFILFDFSFIQNKNFFRKDIQWLNHIEDIFELAEIPVYYINKPFSKSITSNNGSYELYKSIEQHIPKLQERCMLQNQIRYKIFESTFENASLNKPVKQNYQSHKSN